MTLFYLFALKHLIFFLRLLFRQIREMNEVRK